MASYQREDIKHDVTLNRDKVIKYIIKLKLNCANDGITAVHLRHGIGSPLIDVMMSMLSVCLKFGGVPSSFRTGVLVPIFKKSVVTQQYQRTGGQWSYIPSCLNC